MGDISVRLVEFMREAWLALSAVIVMFAVLAMMSNIFKTAGASILGANLWVWEATAATVSILGLALFAFVGIPAITSSLSGSMVISAQCGPMDDLTNFAVKLIAGLASLRMLLAVFQAIASSAFGANVSMSSALMESGEAILGMLIVSLAVPLTAQFLGVC